MRSRWSELEMNKHAISSNFVGMTCGCDSSSIDKELKTIYYRFNCTKVMVQTPIIYTLHLLCVFLYVLWVRGLSIKRFVSTMCPPFHWYEIIPRKYLAPHHLILVVWFRFLPCQRFVSVFTHCSQQKGVV